MVRYNSGNFENKTKKEEILDVIEDYFPMSDDVFDSLKKLSIDELKKLKEELIHQYSEIVGKDFVITIIEKRNFRNVRAYGPFKKEEAEEKIKDFEEKDPYGMYDIECIRMGLLNYREKL
jgi:hypothetical protein